MTDRLKPAPRPLDLKSRLLIKSGSIAVLLIAAGYVFCPKPDLITFQNYSRAFLDKKGTLLRITLASDERYRLYTPLNKITPVFQQATILYEDKNFHHHFGVDVSALLRAFWSTYFTRGRRIGGSTIAMQVARLRWRMETTKIPGKIWQILRAIQLPRHFLKDEILEAYFNLASYGRNIEGIGAASLIYFDKRPDRLSLSEALSLAVIPQNPSRRNPTSKKGLIALSKARGYLYRRWIVFHPQDIDKKVFLKLALSIRSPDALPFLAPHFVNNLNADLLWLTHGFINTILDSQKQAIVKNIISLYVQRRKNEGIHNAVALLLNHDTMEVEAMVGSADFFNRAIDGQVNGVSAKRSPGSALKPFVYALAMDQGLIHPMTLLKDSPSRFAGFTPENYDKRFLGPVFARNALITSRNVPAVTLQSQLSGMSFYQFLQEAGITGLKEEDYYGLALVLGGSEITMEEMLKLYAMLANGGKLKPIQKLLDVPIDRSDEKQLLSAESSFLIMDILKDNPTPSSLNMIGSTFRHNDVVWKTGTSHSFRDAWAVGISGAHVLAVWVGNFQGHGNSAFIGRTAAGPLLFELFEALQANRGWKITDFIDPSRLNLRKVSVCANTGDLPGRHCPVAMDSWFIPGVSPIKVSTVHRAVPIDKNTGLRSCRSIPGKTVSKVYEFWPSDFLHIFQMAGISLKFPPEYGVGCDLNDKSMSGQNPVIKSPQHDVTYVLRSDLPDQDRIPLSAVVDTDAKELFWFINGSYVGKANRNKVFFWQSKIGDFSVTVVDDHGRAARGFFKTSMER